MLKQKAIAAYVGLAIFMMDEMAHAQGRINTSTGKAKLQSVLQNSTFQTTVTVAFAILAFWKWIEFLQGFKADSALKDAITPAILTFMAFSWGDVMTWVGLL